jgi:hypothetical protein
MLYAYTTEAYPTYCRTIGYGYSSSFGRVGSSLMPYTIFPLYELNVNLLYFLYNRVFYLF